MTSPVRQSQPEPPSVDFAVHAVIVAVVFVGYTAATTLGDIVAGTTGFVVGSTLTIAATAGLVLGRRDVLFATAESLLRFLSKLRGFSAGSLTDLAVLLAGRQRPALRAEWNAHLAGGSGHDPATWPKVRQALGFVAAAIQLRLADVADLAWRPVDAVLGSRTLSNLFVGGPVIVVLMAIVHHDGRFGLVTDIQDTGQLGAFLYGAIRTGRWWRGIKLPEPKARRARE